MSKKAIDFLIKTVTSLESSEVDSLAKFINQMTGLDAARLKKIIGSTTKAKSREDFLRQLLKLPLQEQSYLLKAFSQGEWSEKWQEFKNNIPAQATAMDQSLAKTAAKLEAWIDKERKKSLFARLAQKFIR